ncbi:MAG: MerR family transcriptional regulator [Gulosibacter sp.]|uniref:MerR family transcriptional regulator n=1 Tax=Gulosibacter sp. TaxID=2817531 RepID=UPI003F8EBB49
MLKIGDFAGITGLTVKALRHYDEKAVLVPNTVDEQTGYRLYAEGQVRAGVLVRALRAAGVPLEEIDAASDASSAQDVLSAHRQRVLREREEEDRAFRDVENELSLLSAPVRVEERRMPRLPFVGRVLAFSADNDAALINEEATAAFAQLDERANHAGLTRSGRFWTTLRSGDNGQVEVIGCWAASDTVVESWPYEEDLIGVLPARTELVATWPSSDSEELPADATHPAEVAIFDALEERGIELHLDGMEVRQEMIAHGAGDYSVEVSVTTSIG